MLVVGGTGRRLGRPSLPQPVARVPVLRRRIRDARRGLHLERHRRSRSRRQGRAHPLAPDPVGPGEREGGGGLPRRAGAGRAHDTGAVQPLHDPARDRLACHRGVVSAGQAGHVVAADRAGARVLVGRADGLGGGVLKARCAGAAALCGLDRLGDRLRHDLRTSGPRGRCADRREVDRAAVRRAHAGWR